MFAAADSLRRASLTTLLLLGLAGCASGEDSPPDGTITDAGAATDEDAGVSDAGISTLGDAGAALDAGFVTETIVDEDGMSRTIVNGPFGEPATVGCSDGQREGLNDDSVFVDIAACLGSWSGVQSLRTDTATIACGDDLGVCPFPAAMCAPGWRVCGSTGDIADVLRLSADQCDTAGGGRYVFGLSHCLETQGCAYDREGTTPYPCFESGWCSEPICCGEACTDFGICRDGAWPERTRIAVGTDQGCGAITGRRAGGVLCCR